MGTPAAPPSRIVLFDGVCNLCNGFVRFIVHRDPQARFRFGTLQDHAARLIPASGVLHPEELATVVYLRHGRPLVRSTAALWILRDLGGAWTLCFAFIVVPRPIRDAVYRWVARHRYRWFGRRDTCMVPTPDLRTRFLGPPPD